MSNPSNATNEATQKPATVAVAAPGRAGKRGEPSGEPSGEGVYVTGAVLADRIVRDDGTVLPTADELRALLTEALTVLTIYAEVAVPVPSYRGVPMQAHAPRELVERIHRAIGV
jgi:hypothetical protein